MPAPDDLEKPCEVVGCGHVAGKSARNRTETLFPGTELRMVYEIDALPESERPVSSQISRGQEV